jgi:hypothetical protein
VNGQNTIDKEKSIGDESFRYVNVRNQKNVIPEMIESDIKLPVAPY